MNRDDIIHMAKQASGSEWSIFQDFMPELERFAALVAESQRRLLVQEQKASGLPYWIKLEEVNDCIDYHAQEMWRLRAKVQQLERAVLIEREACARVCEELPYPGNSDWQCGTLDCAAAIRARWERD